ncbi:class I SAM-dependent methyltransferase [Vulcanisaeta sp. JCM 16159]|uniref:class I SAM-dependent methyltransferase n=1 Tax=Vulcanisaeta sp. JCM 16159 TaxID=1295371 RepID=UPI0006D0D83A|nr:class I SAM-dependent methyltransferase [Vulcanisaeta sp. JCM 16159]
MGDGMYEELRHFNEKVARAYRLEELPLCWVYIITARVLRRIVRPPARILEIGPGTGRLANMLAGYGYYVVGIDISLPMLRQARRFNKPDFINGTSWQMPIVNGRFDAAVATLTLHHWSRREESIRIIYELLRPGSALIIVEADKDRVRFVGSHGCTERCFIELLSPYFSISIRKMFPLIIAIGKKLK